MDQNSRIYLHPLPLETKSSSHQLLQHPEQQAPHTSNTKETRTTSRAEVTLCFQAAKFIKGKQKNRTNKKKNQDLTLQNPCSHKTSYFGARAVSLPEGPRETQKHSLPSWEHLPSLTNPHGAERRS